MTEQRIGILVEATDKAGAVLKGIGSSGKTALDGIREAGSKAGSVVKGVGMAAVFLNQGIELAKKGMEIFRAVVLDNITAMVEYRGEADGISKQFKEMADEAAYFRAIVADLLTPVILGLRDAFNETGSEIVDYINTNRKLIATNIIEFLAATAKVLTTVLVEGFVWASRAVFGLIEMFHLLSAAVNESAAATLKGITMMLEGYALLADVVPGLDKLSVRLHKTAGKTELLGSKFDEAGDKSIAALEETIATLEAVEEGAREFGDTVIDVVDNVIVPAMLRQVAAMKGVKKHGEEARAANIKALKAEFHHIDALAKLEDDVAAWRAENAKKNEAWNKKLADEQKVADAEVLASKRATYTAVGNLIADTTGTAVLAVIKGEKEIEQAAEDMLKSIAESAGRALLNVAVEKAVEAILTAAVSAVEVAAGTVATAANVAQAEATIGTSSAEAMAKSLAAFAGVPVAGPALGAAQGAALIAAIQATRALYAAEKGLHIPGGGRGGESILHTMRADETVLDPASSKRWERLTEAVERGGSAATGGPSVVVHASFHNAVPDHSAGRKRTMRDLDRSLKMVPGKAFQRA